MPDSPLIIENLSFQYRTRPEPAIQNISFELKPGEMLLVAGASGCGKTTLVRCINGLIPRSYRGDLQGRVLVNREDVHNLSLASLAQTVGTLLQDPEKQILGAHVRAEVAFGPENLGLPPGEVNTRVVEALTRLGLTDLSERETFSLSGGEKQKVALAGLLAMRPSILLLDEPLASLDPASAQEALAIFRRLADEGATIVLIEHRVEDALVAKPDRVLYMKEGHIQYLGSPQGLADVVDRREVKLSAQQVIRQVRARGDKVSPSVHPVQPVETRPLIAFENVSFGYGDDPDVLHNINLRIHAGERVALLGPNGAGKSTLIKHAIGLVKPRQGQVLVEGRDTRQLSVAQVARTLGYCFQSPTQMLFAPTVKEELEFGPKNLRFTAQELNEAVSESIKIVNLVGMEDYPPLALSFGQQKRVTIACVLAMRSKILALDEPTAGQDYGNYMNFMDGILGLHDSGRLASNFEAVLFITHDLDLAVIFASRVILLSDGRVAADGPPEVVLHDRALLERCRIVPTSLLEENLRLLPKTGKFLRAEELAEFV
ncbi:MAG TPA: ABC transporter ATP-binding protein [Anaerolineales bacterium]|nr:ABC transporter ATP-binding protein [Anaerolineales bacterium]